MSLGPGTSDGNSSKSQLSGLLKAAIGRVATLALLDFAWFMVLPLGVGLFVDARLGATLPVAVGTFIELLRLRVRHKVRRSLRGSFMSRTARQALRKSTAIPEARSDAAFWGAHIAEYAVSIDAPAIVGAGVAGALTLCLAGMRLGAVPVLEIGGVLLSAVVFGVLSNRLRRRGVDAVVDQRQLTATWMAAAVRDQGELASTQAASRFLGKLTEAAETWCAAEDAVEQARTWHRLLIAFCTGLALWAVASTHGFDAWQGMTSATAVGDPLVGALLLGTCLPTAYAFASHLESISVANTELARLALGLSERPTGAETKLQERPLTLSVRSVSARHESHLALDLGNLEISLQSPLGVAGPNGSGKTTFATLVSGVRAASTGAVMLEAVAATDVCRDDIAFVPQDPVLIECLSVEENIQLVATDYLPSDASALLAALGLRTPLDRLVGSLSRGEQRRIATARALLKRPKLLVLDEPDAWLDVEGRRDLIDTLKQISQQTSIIVVSHRLDVLGELEVVVVLNAQHQVEAVAHPNQLLSSSPTFRALLGLDETQALGT